MDFESRKSSKAAGAIRVDHQLYRKETAPPDGLAALSSAEMPINELAAVVHRNVAALVAAEINLARAGDFLLRVKQHFLPLGDPA